jgi:hypothetical protein
MLLITLLVFSVTSVVLVRAQTSNSDIEKIVFIHYKKGSGKPPVEVLKCEEPNALDIARELYINKGASLQTVAKLKTPKCYTFLSPTKVKWKTLPVNYVINPINPVQLLNKSEVVSAIYNSAEEWDSHTSKELMSNSSQYNINYSATPGVQDYRNVIGFGNYSDPDVIAVTTVWYSRVTNQIVEFDMMLDTDWTWGDAVVQCNSNETFTNSTCTIMDIQNIATHEFGHAIGLGDIYDPACSEVTMYWSSDYGEVKKRTLEQADITGLQTLYGA